MYVLSSAARRSRRCWLGVAAATLALAGVASRQRLAASEEVLPFSKLELAVRTDQTDYVVGQPIALYAELANRDSQPVDAHEFFGWDYRGGALRRPKGEDFLVVEIAWGRGRYQRYVAQNATIDESPPLPASPMAPRTTRKCKVLLVGAGQGAVPLTKPGTLQIRAEFRHVVGQDQKIVSPPVRVSLRQPRGEEIHAYYWLCDRNMLSFLAHRVHHGCHELDIVALRGFAERYAETVYAPYARFGLGQMCLEKKQYEEAIGIFEDLVKRHPKASLAEDAAYLLGECYVQQHKPVEAARCFEEVIRRYPGTPVAQDAEEGLTRLADYWEMLFPEDKRLDVKVNLDFLQPTTLAEVLKVLSVRTGVPFRAAPDFEDRSFWVAFPRQFPLRRFMASQRLSFTEDRRVQAGAWVREDDGGYRLVPVIRRDWEMQYKLPPKNPEPKRGKPPAGKPAVPGDAKAQPR